MNRIARLFPSAAITLMGLAFLTSPLSAQVPCQGGSIVTDAAGNFAGCMFNTWGPAEQSMCTTPGVVAFAGPSAANCHLCVKQAYAAQIVNDDYTGLKLTPSPISTNPPLDFKCLKCTPPPAGMTSWWTFDEHNAWITDRMKNAPDGFRFGGAQSVQGQVDSAIQFDGVATYAQVPHDAKLDVGTGDFSFDAWVKIDTAANRAGLRVIAEKRTYANGKYKGYSFYLYDGRIALQLADDAGYANYGSSVLAVPADGKWHFVAVSVARLSPVGIQFTLDDKPVEIANPMGHTGSLANPSPLRIGMRSIDNQGAFAGGIDELEFFHRAVTPAEWQLIYNARCYGKCK